MVIGGAILAPLFQDQEFNINRTMFWAATALLLHGGAQFVLTLLEEES